MRNKKGFSLVEILAAIVLVGIVGAISVTAYNEVNKTVLETALENMVLEIEIAAEDYARDTGETTVSVEVLAASGYLTYTDEEEVLSPVDNNSLLCYIVTVSVENGEYVADLNLDVDAETLQEESGTCKTYVITYDSKIDVLCEDGECTKYTVEDKTWYNGTVYLNVASDVDVTDLTSYKWESKSGYGYGYPDDTSDSTISTVEINNTGAISTVYTLSITYADGSVLTSSETINIDNASPSYVSVSKSEGWSSSNKEIFVNATDNGSGVSGYYMSAIDSLSDASTIDCSSIAESEYTDIDETNTLANGYYAVCIIDNVGNTSEVATFEVSNIDGTAPSYVSREVVSSSYSDKSGTEYYDELTLKYTFTDDDSGVASAKYCISSNDADCTPTIQTEVTNEGNDSYSVQISHGSASASTQYACVEVIDSVGNSNTVCDDTLIYFDNTAPTVTLSETDSAYLVLINAVDNESGIQSYTCNYGTSSTSLKESSVPYTENGNTYCKLDDLEIDETYYVEVTATNKAGLTASSTTTSVFSYEPEITLQDAYEVSCGNDEYCDDVIFVSFNGKTFGIYRSVSTGYKALYQGALTYMYESTSSIGCCDSGQCTETNASYLLSKISTFVDNFVAAYTGYKTKLVNYSFCVAPVESGICSTTYTSYAGLLDYDEFFEIDHLTTLFSHDTYSSNSYAFLANRYSSSYSGLTSFTYSSSKGAYYSIESTTRWTTHANVKPVFVFKKTLVISSGSGTYSDPYVV